ncbi:nuclear transport factor 2 family protein [Pseudomonas sp. PB3P13]
MHSPVFMGVHEVLCRFFAAFDKRNWTSMNDCLASEVFIDYSSSGREAPGIMSGEEFVQRRATALDNLTKQHSFSNLYINCDADVQSVRASCNYLILRFDLRNPKQDENFFHSCGEYVFELDKFGDEWKITSIKQLKLQSWGNIHLHGGTATIPS